MSAFWARAASPSQPDREPRRRQPSPSPHTARTTARRPGQGRAAPSVARVALTRTSTVVPARSPWGRRTSRTGRRRRSRRPEKARAGLVGNGRTAGVTRIWLGPSSRSACTQASCEGLQHGGAWPEPRDAAPPASPVPRPGRCSRRPHRSEACSPVPGWGRGKPPARRSHDRRPGVGPGARALPPSPGTEAPGDGVRRRSGPAHGEPGRQAGDGSVGRTVGTVAPVASSRSSSAPPTSPAPSASPSSPPHRALSSHVGAGSSISVAGRAPKKVARRRLAEARGLDQTHSLAEGRRSPRGPGRPYRAGPSATRGPSRRPTGPARSAARCSGSPSSRASDDRPVADPERLRNVDHAEDLLDLGDRERRLRPRLRQLRDLELRGRVVEEEVLADQALSGAAAFFGTPTTRRSPAARTAGCAGSGSSAAFRPPSGTGRAIASAQTPTRSDDRCSIQAEALGRHAPR